MNKTLQANIYFPLIFQFILLSTFKSKHLEAGYIINFGLILQLIYLSLSTIMNTQRWTINDIHCQPKPYSAISDIYSPFPHHHVCIQAGPAQWKLRGEGVLLSGGGGRAINRTNVLQISCTLHLILQALLIQHLFLILFKQWVPPPYQTGSSK